MPALPIYKDANLPGFSSLMQACPPAKSIFYSIISSYSPYFPFCFSGLGSYGIRGPSLFAVDIDILQQASRMIFLIWTRRFSKVSNNNKAHHMSAADKKIRKDEQLAKQRNEKQRQLMQEHKDKMMPLVKFLKKEGLPFKYARVGPNRIEYFRLDDFNRLKEACKDKIEANQQMRELVGDCDNWQCFIPYRRPSDSKTLKYPHMLQPTMPSDPQAKFCSFKFDTTLSRKMLMFSILIGALALVLFPVWPFSVKYAIWLISLYLLVILLGLLVVRLVIYLLCVVVGFNVWIFPNLLGDYGFLDSFRPIFYAQRWQTSKLNIAIRVFAFLLLAYYGVQLYIDPTFLESHFTVTKGTIQDVHDWGVSKIKNEVKFSERAITNIEDILNETADVEDEPVSQGKTTHQIQNDDEANRDAKNYQQQDTGQQSSEEGVKVGVKEQEL